MNVLELLQDQLTDERMGTLMRQVGVEDKEQAQSATNGIISTLMGALAKNASSPEGRDSLSRALDNDHDGSILDHMTDLFAGNTQNLSNRAVNGAGILQHILGGKQSGAADLISKMTGMDKNAVFSMMIKLAPVVLGAVGRQKQRQNLNSGGLADLLSGTVQSDMQARQEMGVIGRFLDQDGDGSVMDDLLNIGGKALGGFFKR